MIHVSPKHDAGLSQFLLFRSTLRQMFYNNISIRIPFPDFRRHPLQVCDTFRIIFIGPCILRSIGKSFSKIVSKTIHFILFHPETGHTVHQRTGIRTLMIKIISPLQSSIRNIRLLIIPGIICRRSPIRLTIEQIEWRLPKTVIQYQVYNHCYPLPMAFVNKSPHIIFSSIILIHRKIKRRIISPTAIPFKLINRHQFNGIDSQLFQIGQFVFRRIKGMFGSKIANMHLVYH